MENMSEVSNQKPLLLKFSPGIERGLNRDMLGKLAKFHGWSATHTIHVALARMFYTTFPELIDDGPIPGWLQETSISLADLVKNAQETQTTTLMDWVKEKKTSVKRKQNRG